MGRTKPNPLEKERERKLQRIAQRLDCCDVVMTHLFTVMWYLIILSLYSLGFFFSLNTGMCTDFLICWEYLTNLHKKRVKNND